MREKAEQIASQAPLPQPNLPVSDPRNGRQSTGPDTQCHVQLGVDDFQYTRWSGQELAGEWISFDTETALIEPLTVPDLALASVSDGSIHCLIHPDQIGEFLVAHQDRHLVGHNVAFDFWVVQRHLDRSKQREALIAWWGLPDQARLHDTMWLDALIRLAQSDAFPQTRNLGQVAHEYTGLNVDKLDPYRLRYSEIIGQEWENVNPGFFDYAIKDAIVTHRAFTRMVTVAKKILAPFQVELLPSAVERFGLLTEAVQVQGAIALEAITRNGIHLDAQRVQQTQTSLQDEMAKCVTQLGKMPEGAEIFRTNKAGNFKLAPKSRAPCVNQKVLTRVLEQIASDAEEEITIPTTTKTGALTTSVKFWAQYAHVHPFISRWVSMAKLAKLSQFFANLQSDRIYPRYTVLVRTGRTSCSNPNIQQLPRSAGFREMVVVSPGHYLFAIDYAAIELRTLAAICEHRYGTSVLANVIREGVDPHAYTAALFDGLSLEEFMSLKEANPERFKKLRQQAKALNFGIPGGLGAASLVSYASSTYGVTLTVEEARAFRQELIENVYPELSRYLTEDSIAILARSLRVDVDLCRSCFRSTSGLRNVVRGSTQKANGEPYDPAWHESVWDKLVTLNKNQEIDGMLRARKGSDDLVKLLFWSPVVTPTGRVRGRVSFSQVRNTPFQGLAADGAKRAIFKLIMAGYRCVAFIHDEVLIELPVDCDHALEAIRIDQIMRDAMQEITGSVPVECEYVLSHRWSKDAVPIFSDEGQLLPWGDPPKNEQVIKSPETLEPSANVHESDTEIVTKLVPEFRLEKPRTEIYVGDCRGIIPKLDVQPELIFADPPFNIDEQYGTWNDNMPWPEYVEFTYDWIDACLTVLSSTGSIWIHVPDQIAAEIVMHLKQRGLEMINWCALHFRFGQCRTSNFIVSKCHGLYFARDREKRTWNPDEVMVPSDRATKYKDKRTQQTKTPGMRVPLDIFGLPDDGANWGRVQGNNRERRHDHENQLPEVYLARIIKALSNEGDLVLDPFAGSGTTATVARALNRRSVNIEVDNDNVISLNERIKKGPVRDVVSSPMAAK